MYILQINYCMRVIERVYKNISEIDTEEYEIEKILQCCRGELASYGGLYSENGIWRFLKDMPFLKSNFDFYDTNIYGINISIPGNVDFELNNMLLFSEQNTSLKNEEIIIENDIKRNKKILNNVRNNSTFSNNNYFKNGIAQIKNNKIITIYPDSSFIPSWIYNINHIKHILNKNIEYMGYKWMKYDLIHNYLNRNIQIKTTITGNILF